MISFKDYVKQSRGVEVPEGNISGEWFMQHSVPMVVRCSCCEMTMVSPSAWIDEEGYTYCSTCAGIDGE